MEDIDDSVSERRSMWIWGIVGLLVLAALGWGLHHMLSGNAGKTKKAPVVSLLPTTPPPPPPPPKEEKKPEPPKEQQKEVQVDKQVDKQMQPPDQTLKMEGAAGDGPSPFAAGKVTSEDVSNLGGKGGALDPFANYAALAKGELQRYLARQNELKKRRYKVEVKVWVGGDGAVKRSELMGSSGDSDVDQSIERALAGGLAFSDRPPAGMPQPIRFLITTGGRG